MWSFRCFFVPHQETVVAILLHVIQYNRSTKPLYSCVVVPIIWLPFLLCSAILCVSTLHSTFSILHIPQQPYHLFLGVCAWITVYGMALIWCHYACQLHWSVHLTDLSLIPIFMWTHTRDHRLTFYPPFAPIFHSPVFWVHIGKVQPPDPSVHIISGW
jgi:hypothetical protein